jgi:hypothetical protein
VEALKQRIPNGEKDHRDVMAPLRDAPPLVFPSTIQSVTPEWKMEVRKRLGDVLSKSCNFPSADVGTNDIFLASFIHPSHFPQGALRQLYSLPAETVLIGRSAAALVVELAKLESRSAVELEVAEWMIRERLAEFVLYDRKKLNSAQDRRDALTLSGLSVVGCVHGLHGVAKANELLLHTICVKRNT